MLTAVERVLADCTRTEAVGRVPDRRCSCAYATAPAARRPRCAVPESARISMQLRSAAPGIGFERWTRDDAARALLLIDIRNAGPHRRRVRRPTRSSASSRATRASNRAGCARIALWPEAEGVSAGRDRCVPHQHHSGVRSAGVRESVSGGAFSRAQLQPDGVEGDVQRDRARAHRRPAVAAERGAVAHGARLRGRAHRRRPHRARRHRPGHPRRACTQEHS